jgi:hypothetical protein
MLPAGQFNSGVKNIAESVNLIIKSNAVAIQAMQGLLRKA